MGAEDRRRALGPRGRPAPPAGARRSAGQRRAAGGELQQRRPRRRPGCWPSPSTRRARSTGSTRPGWTPAPIPRPSGWRARWSGGPSRTRWSWRASRPARCRLVTVMTRAPHRVSDDRGGGPGRPDPRGAAAPLARRPRRRAAAALRRAAARRRPRPPVSAALLFSLSLALAAGAGPAAAARPRGARLAGAHRGQQPRRPRRPGPAAVRRRRRGQVPRGLLGHRRGGAHHPAHRLRPRHGAALPRAARQGPLAHARPARPGGAPAGAGRRPSCGAAGRSVRFYFVFAGHGDVDGGRGFLELADGPFTAEDLQRLVGRRGRHRVARHPRQLQLLLRREPPQAGGRALRDPARRRRGAGPAAARRRASSSPPRRRPRSTSGRSCSRASSATPSAPACWAPPTPTATAA